MKSTDPDPVLGEFDDAAATWSVDSEGRHATPARLEQSEHADPTPAVSTAVQVRSGHQARPTAAPDCWIAVGATYEVSLHPTHLLGSGGHGSVYLGRERVSHRRVAVKLVAPQTEGQRERILREVEVLRANQHPNVVGILGQAELADGRLALVLEYLPGGSLRSAIRERVLTVDEALGIAQDVCKALGHLHAAGVIHRDLKPANILLSADGAAKLSDFGVALLTDEPRITTEGFVVGTPSYLPPEAYLGRDIGPPADHWALGVVLFEMLTHTFPFPTTTVPIHMAAVTASPPRGLEYVARLDLDLERLIRQLLAASPADRPTASVAEQALQRVRTGLRDRGLDTLPLPVDIAGSQTPEFPLTLQEDQPALVQLRERVRRFWIEPVLALAEEHGQLVLQCVALEHVLGEWRVQRRPDGDGFAFRPAFEFERAARRLMVLGGIGSGRSTALVQIAAGLVEASKHDPSAPVPVLLSWRAQGGMDFETWLSTALTAQHHLPLAHAERWVREGRIAVLLEHQGDATDGFSDLAAFLSRHPRLPFVVTGKEELFLVRGPDLFLERTLALRPLAPEQVDAWISRRQTRSVLRDNDQWRSFALTPLALVVTEEVLDTHREYQHLDKANLLWKAYLDAVVGRLTSHRVDDVHNGLAWVARRMKRDETDHYSPQDIRPSSLTSGTDVAIYHFASRMSAGLLLGAIHSRTLQWDAAAALFATPLLPAPHPLPWGGLAIGLLVGIAAATWDTYLTLRRPDTQRWSRTRDLVTLWLLLLTVELSYAAITGDYIAPLGTPMVALWIRYRGTQHQNHRLPARPLRKAWSWEYATSATLAGAVIMLPWSAVLAHQGRTYTAAALWMGGAAWNGAVFGWRALPPRTQIATSAADATRHAVAVGCVATLVFGVPQALIGDTSPEALTCVVAAGVLAFFLSGGTQLLDHLILRGLAYIEQPFHLEEILESAGAAGILRKHDHGWTFAESGVAEYLANASAPQSQRPHQEA